LLFLSNDEENITKHVLDRSTGETIELSTVIGIVLFKFGDSEKDRKVINRN
jgi:hypothetical protein